MLLMAVVVTNPPSRGGAASTVVVPIATHRPFGPKHTRRPLMAFLAAAKRIGRSWR